MVGARPGARPSPVLRNPLLSAGGGLCYFPVMAEQVLEVVVVPLDRVAGPCAFQPAGDRVRAFAAAKGIYPAEALIFDTGALGLGPHIRARFGSAVGFAEGVSAGDEGHRLLVIHGHPAESLPDVLGRGQRIRSAVWPFRIHVDEAHLNRAERIIQLAVTAVALVSQPLALRAPKNVVFRLPDIFAPAAETEGLESHRLQRDVPRKNHQVGPGKFPAVLLLDGPEQPARFVQAHVIRPAVEGGKSLRSGACPTAAIRDTVGAR